MRGRIWMWEPTMCSDSSENPEEPEHWALTRRGSRCASTGRRGRSIGTTEGLFRMLTSQLSAAASIDIPVQTARSRSSSSAVQESPSRRILDGTSVGPCEPHQGMVSMVLRWTFDGCKPSKPTRMLQSHDSSLITVAKRGLSNSVSVLWMSWTL